MNANTNTPEAIAKLLTSAAQRLDGRTVAALRQARNVALQRQSLSRSVSLSTGHGMHWLMPHSANQWAATAILLVATVVGGLNYWQHTQEHELVHLDIAILTDDLPLEVFVD